MCVRGCSLASMWFNYKDERRLALGTIWCKVNLYFVRSRFILYRILCIWHLHVHGDQITMHISMYILCCSGKIVYILLRCQSLCIFGRVRWMCLSGVSCSLFDLMVWEVPVTMVSFKSLSLKTFSFKWLGVVLPLLGCFFAFLGLTVAWICRICRDMVTKDHSTWIKHVQCQDILIYVAFQVTGGL